MTASGRPAWLYRVQVEVERLVDVGPLLHEPDLARRSPPTARAPRGRASGRRRRSAGPRRAARARARLSSVSAALAIRRTAASGSRARRVAGPSAILISALAIVSRPLAQRRPRRDEHDLRVRRRAVVLDAELARLEAALLERHALGVPEHGHGVDALGQQPADRVEADRDLLDLRRRRRRRARRSRFTNAGSDGRPETPTVRPSRSRGRATSGCATSAASGLPTSAPTATTSRARLARDREVVDVEHAEVDLAARRRA